MSFLIALAWLADHRNPPSRASWFRLARLLRRDPAYPTTTYSDREAEIAFIWHFIAAYGIPLAELAGPIAEALRPLSTEGRRAFFDRALLVEVPRLHGGTSWYVTQSREDVRTDTVRVVPLRFVLGDRQAAA